MNIEHIALAALQPYEQNSRTHSLDQVAQIAASIQEFGFTNPLLVNEDYQIIAGQGRLLAAAELKMPTVPVICLSGLSGEQQRALILADNQLALNAGWDDDLLSEEVKRLEADDFDLELLGFDDGELARLLADDEEEAGPDVIQDPQPDPISKTGDVWILGDHRVMCGDSTLFDDVEKLMAGQRAKLLHADPPYGMGKEGDGVANDNLYREQLDAFQVDWWTSFRIHLVDNASAYIWGNAPDLWRLWYQGGLGASELLALRNEIVWDKKSAPGIASEIRQMYSTVSERALFIQIGDQLFGNINADGYFEGWDVSRLYLVGEAEAAGLTPTMIREICGCQMYSHWFTKSPWSLMPENHYTALAAHFVGRFLKPWSELKAGHDKAQAEYRAQVSDERSYFDNTHDNMTDVWEFGRVIGDERHGHATPKPVEMMERVMRSSLPSGGLCVEPFGGSGSTLMGAERTGRRCYTMELQAVYVDVIIKRWQTATGQDAILESTGETYNALG